MYRLRTSEREEQTIDTPAWVDSVVAACQALSRTSSSTVGSVVVRGTFAEPRPSLNSVLRWAEKLAEEQDLEVTVDAAGDSFTFLFRKAEL